MNEYCTLEQVRDFLTSSNIDMSRDDDQRVMLYIHQVSRTLDEYCGDRKFYPWVETRDYNFQKSYKLLLDEDLLEVSTLTAGGTEVSDGDYFLYPLNRYPKWKIEIDRSKSSIFNYSGTLQNAIAVEGIWGWHNDWGNAWLNSGDTVQDDPQISAAATTITVADGDGADGYGFTPRFSKAQTIKVEDEYMSVTGVDWTANTVTVIRGVNGTTAATHAKDTAIYTYLPPGDIPLATLQGVKFVYETRTQLGGLILMPSLEGTVVRAELEQIWKGFHLPVRPDSLMVFV